MMIAIAPVASCLLAPTPSDIQAARVTPPYLSAFYPDPLKIWIVPRISAAPNGPPTFAPREISFDVVSEDLASSNLNAAIVLDYQGPASASPGQVVGSSFVIPPGHLDDPEPRHVTITFVIPASTEAGCHSLTLVVTHQFKGFLPVPAHDGDAAYAVWWLDVDDDITAPKASLSRCAAEFPHASDGGTAGGSGGVP
jgi:hypothetical protein